jgi:hypothetical protein
VRFEITKDDKSINNKNKVDTKYKFWLGNLKILIIHLVEFKDKKKHSSKLRDHFTFLNEEEIKDPLTIHKAFTSSIKWKEAIKQELDSIIKINMCELKDLPKDTKKRPWVVNGF